MTNTTINKEVNVTSVGFKKNMTAYPRQVEFDGSTISFLDAGISCIVRSGERIAQIFTLTDGRSEFRLRSDNNGGVWTLLSISA